MLLFAWGGLTQEQVKATVAAEFDVLKKITDASEKTVHSLQLKIGELKTIIDNPTNGVQNALTVRPVWCPSLVKPDS